MQAIVSADRFDFIGSSDNIPELACFFLPEFEQLLDNKYIVIGYNTYSNLKNSKTFKSLISKYMFYVLVKRHTYLAENGFYQIMEVDATGRLYGINFITQLPHDTLNLCLCGGHKMYRHFLKQCTDLYVLYQKTEFEGADFKFPYPHHLKSMFPIVTKHEINIDVVATHYKAK